MTDKKINGSLEITGKLNPNASGYGFNFPSSASLTADKTIATETYVDGALSSKADLVNGLVPAAQLPSYVDDVLESLDVGHFPSTGEEGKIYVALDTGYTYRWSGSEYVQIGGQDLSNFVTLDTDQTITGNKIFSNGIKLGANTKIEGSANSITLDAYGSAGTIYTKSKIAPSYDSQRDLGAASLKWKDIYVSGNLSDGTNSVSVSDIASSTFNVINASDIVNNTLTQEQYDLITNGKPTLIKGELRNYKDLLFVSGVVYGNSFMGIGICTAKTGGFGQNLLLKILINETTKAVSFGSKHTTFNYDGGLGVVGLDTVNGKAIPTYPSTNTSPQALQIGVNGGNLSWSDDGLINVINAEDIVSQTLTEEQFSLFTNGKPTLIKGTYNNFVNALIMPTNQIAGTYTLGMIIGRVINGNVTISSYYLNNTTRTLYYYAQSDRINAIGGIKSLNGKDLPTYPSNTGTFNLKQIDGALAWTKEWYGTQAEYDALGTYDDNTIYNITEE